MTGKPSANGPCGITAWVDAAPEWQREFREAVHIILAAMARDPELGGSIVMKGGILMGICHQSPRFTTDIDFSTTRLLAEIDPERIRRSVDQAMARISAGLEYDLECRIQGYRVNPPNRPDATFPSIELKIGYAYRGTPKHKRLLGGNSPTVVSIDISLNECILEVESFPIGEEKAIQIYSLNDLVAEKIRSLLQQVVRNRYRRQDVYDLNLLLTRQQAQMDCASILVSLRAKASSRGIEVAEDSLDHPEVKRRAREEYHTLADEILGPLPDFNEAYERLVSFYRSLPW